MRELYPGHLYELDHLDGKLKTTLQFIQRAPLHKPIEGPTNQEVIRAVIARVKHLDSESPWPGNARILYHLRMAIALHEARAVERHIEKHGLEVEHITLGQDGHFLLESDNG